LRLITHTLPPAVIALLLQFTACVLALLSLRLTGLQITPLYFALACGLFAALLSYLANLARWWLIIQLIFAPALVLMLTFNLPPWIFLAAFLLLLAVYWSTFQTQVPLYLSSNKVWHELEALLPSSLTPDGTTNHSIKPSQYDGQVAGYLPACAGTRFRFIDLGSGLGGVLTHLARIRPDGHFSGVESAPLPLFWSWLRTRGRKNCTVHWGSLWDCDLAQYEVVFAYLSPVPMTQLWHKARREMRPGSLFISSTFSIPGQQPDERIMVDDMHHSTLLVWRM
jgi:hypothetical protein